MVLGVRDAGSRCPWGQICLVNLHGLEAKLWVNDVQLPMKGKYSLYSIYKKSTHPF